MPVRIDHVAVAFGHALAVRTEDLALIEQSLEWLAELNQPEIFEDADKKAAV